MKIKMLDKTLKIFSNKKFFNEDIYVQIPDGYVKPEGTLDITENGNYDVTQYAQANVNVESSRDDMLQARVDATNSCAYLFYFYTSDNVDYIANLDTSNVTNMISMFYGCSTLVTIPLLDTTKVANMSGMFYNCQLLTSIPQLNTSNVGDMNSMFYQCKILTTIPQLDTSNVFNMSTMFLGCSNLTTIPQLDVSKVTNMYNIFYRCTSLKSILMYGMKVYFDISSSTQFETEDLVTILNNLATVTTTKTLTMGSTNLAKLSDEQKQIAIDKGWTLA